MGSNSCHSGSISDIPTVWRDHLVTPLCLLQVKRLQEVLGEDLKGCSIYLIGMMGSGKSTTGKMLANTLK